MNENRNSVYLELRRSKQIEEAERRMRKQTTLVLFLTELAYVGVLVWIWVR